MSGIFPDNNIGVFRHWIQMMPSFQKGAREHHKRVDLLFLFLITCTPGLICNLVLQNLPRRRPVQSCFCQLAAYSSSTCTLWHLGTGLKKIIS